MNIFIICKTQVSTRTIINLYDNIPDKRSEYFLPYAGYDDMPLDERLLPEVTFENSPQEVEIKLVN